MPPLSMMMKPVSSACNMRCRYCFYADVAAHRAQASYGVMSAQTTETLIRKAFLYADQSVSFAFQGGEPTLAGVDYYRNFLSLVKKYNSRGLQVSYALQTNALALTDEMCALFREHHFLLGVSLDGCRETHDALRPDARGEGTYDRVLQGIALLRKHGVDFNILCVVTQQVAARPHAVWNALKEYGYLQFIPCIDDFEGDANPYSLRPEAYGRFLINTFDDYEKAMRAGRPVSERRFDNYLSILLGQRPELCGMTGQCGLYFLVEADGGVYPCDFYVLDAYRLGNIHETSFARMEKSAQSVDFRRSSLQLPEACRACKWLSMCRGGCRRDRQATLESALGENRFCESYRMFFESCFDRMRALAASIR